MFHVILTESIVLLLKPIIRCRPWTSALLYSSVNGLQYPSGHIERKRFSYLFAQDWKPTRVLLVASEELRKLGVLWISAHLTRLLLPECTVEKTHNLQGTLWKNQKMELQCESIRIKNLLLKRTTATGNWYSALQLGALSFEFLALTFLFFRFFPMTLYLVFSYLFALCFSVEFHWKHWKWCLPKVC